VQASSAENEILAMKSALHERAGCATSLAPRPASRRKPLSREEYVAGILRGDRTVLARAVTLIESALATDRQLAELIVEDCLPHSGNSIRVGVTGVPGAGKSSLIEALGKYLITEQKQKIAVLAIDPSSQLSGGSILGDKTRMTNLAANEMAFIRPSPSRGIAGGVAQRTREVMLLCEAAGYGIILVETVGVGQSETAVHEMVDFFLLITLAGAGDDLQGIKRGVMELADLIAVNKADGSNVAAAERARAEAQNALHYFPLAETGWTPRAITCSAHTGTGISELWSSVMQYVELTRENNCFAHLRREQQKHWMHAMIEQLLRQRFEAHPGIRQSIAAFEQDVAAGRTTSFRAARTLVKIYSDASSR
jgi:LAO/AO transport system kinase